MKLDEIVELWNVDSEIDKTLISNESIKIPKLHNKYYKIFSQEKLALKKLDTDYKRLYRDKYEYYMGTLDRETLEDYKWKPNPRTIIKSDIPMYIEADQDVINLTLKIAYQKEKIAFLESIIQNISNRGFMIKNFIDWQRFVSGGS
jgi:Recombination, repair and ssDNA binding protein UvsY